VCVCVGRVCRGLARPHECAYMHLHLGRMTRVEKGNARARTHVDTGHILPTRVKREAPVSALRRCTVCTRVWSMVVGATANGAHTRHESAAVCARHTWAW
jgi:hypothetical protein